MKQSVTLMYQGFKRKSLKCVKRPDRLQMMKFWKFGHICCRGLTKHCGRGCKPRPADGTPAEKNIADGVARQRGLTKHCGRGCKPRPADGTPAEKNIADGVANPVRQMEPQGQ